MDVYEIVKLKQIVNKIEVPFGNKVSSQEQIGKWLQSEIGDDSSESLILICLDTKNQVTYLGTVFVGSLSHLATHPRDIFQRVILSNAAGFIIAHNHPSGNYNPSESDYKFTKQIIEGSKLLGLRFQDHIIVGRNGYISLFEENIFDFGI